MSELDTAAEQLGLTADDAIRALQYGARMLSHRLSEDEIDDMFIHVYKVRNDDEQAFKSGHPTFVQLRRYLRRQPPRDES